MLWQKTDRTFTGTIVRFINVGRNNPIPAKFTKINTQRVPTTSRLSIIFPTISGHMTLCTMLTHVSRLNFNVWPLQKLLVFLKKKFVHVWVCVRWFVCLFVCLLASHQRPASHNIWCVRGNIPKHQRTHHTIEQKNKAWERDKSAMAREGRVQRTKREKNPKQRCSA